MSDTELQLKAVDRLVHLHATMRNAPPENVAIMNFIETLYLYLLEKLRQEAPAVFALLEKQALSGADSVNQQKDETIPVSSLMDIFRALDTKSISFDKDLESEELRILIKLPAKTGQTVKDEIEAPKFAPENETEDVVNAAVAINQAIASEPEIAEAGISDSVTEMQKVFNRLKEMDGTIASFLFEEQKDLIKKLSRQAVEWLESETAATPAYKERCLSLQALLQDFINHGLFAEAYPIVNVFSRINKSELKKDDTVRAVALEVLGNLASEDNINILFKEIDINEKNKTADACQILFGFGDIVIKKILHRIRYATESKERIHFIHIIQEMGQIAIPSIRESITVDAPWYYLRNMAYLLGRIGNEASVDILRSLLLYKDKRVRAEAFKSLGQTGGNKRGQVYLSILPYVEPEMRISIIEMLGKIKCVEAVDDLQDMLKAKTSMTKEDQISLQEKACIALGAIGSPEAVKILSEVAESKSFLSIQSYPTEVKYAAKRALEYIKRK